MAEVVAISSMQDSKKELISNRAMIVLYRKMAEDCSNALIYLNKVKDNDATWFIETGGINQIIIYENEVEVRNRMADILEGEVNANL
jgi:hypothetical protein